MRFGGDSNHQATYSYIGRGAAAGPGGAAEGATECRSARRCVGALFSVGTLLFTGFVYNLVYLMRVLPVLGKSQWIAPFAALFNVPWGLTMASYLQASTSDPGSVPERWRQFAQVTGPSLPVFEAAYTWQHGRATACSKCSQPRPERAHHCKICDQCVLRMDHHCPWINNCVGLGNHKFFLLLVFYAALTSVVGILTSLPELLYIIWHLLSRDGQTWQPQFVSGRLAFQKVEFALPLSDSLALLAVGGLGLVLCLLLFALLTSHLPLTLEGLTTIEENYGKEENPYDLHSATANLAQVFGAFGPDWLLPLAPWRPTSDGIVYPPLADCYRYYGNGPPPTQPEDFWRARYGVRPPVQQLQSQDEEKEGGGNISWLGKLWR